MQAVNFQALPESIQHLLFSHIRGGYIDVHVGYDPDRHLLRWWRLRAGSDAAVGDPVPSGAVQVPFELLPDAESIGRGEPDPMSPRIFPRGMVD